MGHVPPVHLTGPRSRRMLCVGAGRRFHARAAGSIRGRAGQECVLRLPAADQVRRATRVCPQPKARGRGAAGVAYFGTGLTPPAALRLRARRHPRGLGHVCCCRSAAAGPPPLLVGAGAGRRRRLAARRTAARRGFRRATGFRAGRRHPSPPLRYLQRPLRLGGRRRAAGPRPAAPARCRPTGPAGPVPGLPHCGRAWLLSGRVRLHAPPLLWRRRGTPHPSRRYRRGALGAAGAARRAGLY
mmetsp:Transcript_2280/g.7192  ORF Transcript_2280/g.7192 Transcript_2280/m.7192 type:complete len:242 (+) Transcript_2280:228-953(+)